LKSGKQTVRRFSYHPNSFVSVPDEQAPSALRLEKTACHHWIKTRSDELVNHPAKLNLHELSVAIHVTAGETQFRFSVRVDNNPARKVVAYEVGDGEMVGVRIVKRLGL